MISLLFFMFLFIALSGIMAAVDAAVLSVSRPEISEMIVQRKWGAMRLDTLKGNLTRAVVVIVVLTNTINVIGPIVVSQKAVALYGTQAIALTVIVLALGTIVFSEIIPKALGAHYAPVIGRLTAPFIQGATIAFFPLVLPLERLAELFKRGKRTIGSEEQIRALVSIGQRAGLIESDEMQMIRRAFILNDRTAGDIMTPLKEVVALFGNMTVGEAAEKMRAQPYSRFPVAGQSLDDICGIAMSRDVLEAVVDGRGDEPLQPLVRPAFLVDIKRRSDWLLSKFRDQHTHLGVVQDGGRTVGVVTLEDVLEELVGEIEDEKDIESGQPGGPDAAEPAIGEVPPADPYTRY